jgi:lipoprotein-releasing system permease protein
MMISVVGCLVGMGLGAIVCYLQMEFGFLKIAENSTFVYNAYPVAFNPADFVVVFLTVFFIGLVTSWFLAKMAYKNLSA